MVLSLEFNLGHSDPSHTSVSGPPTHMLLVISRLLASLVVCIPHARNYTQIFNDKISILRKSDWLVLVAVMLIYRPPAQRLEKSRTKNKVQLGVALLIRNLWKALTFVHC